MCHRGGWDNGTDWSRDLRDQVEDQGLDMFTGIVEELGAIISIDKTLAGTRMAVLASIVMGDLKIGRQHQRQRHLPDRGE